MGNIYVPQFFELHGACSPRGVISPLIVIKNVWIRNGNGMDDNKPAPQSCLEQIAHIFGDLWGFKPQKNGKHIGYRFGDYLSKII